MAKLQQIEQQPSDLILPESNAGGSNEAEAIQIQSRLRELDQVGAEAERKKSLLSGMTLVASQVGEDGQISTTEEAATSFLHGFEQRGGE